MGKNEKLQHIKNSRKVSWPINICPTNFVAHAKRPPSYILNVFCG